MVRGMWDVGCGTWGGYSHGPLDVGCGKWDVGRQVIAMVRGE